MEREHEREEFQQEIRRLEEQLRRAARPQPRIPSDGDVSRPRCHTRRQHFRAAPSSSISTHACSRARGRQRAPPGGEAHGPQAARVRARASLRLGRPACFLPSEGAVVNLPVLF